MAQRILVGLAALLACLALAALPATAGAMPPPAKPRLFKLGPGKHASSVGFAPDGALWFAGANVLNSTTVVGRVSHGEVREFKIPKSGTEGFGAVAIIAGPEGAMWFTDFGSDAIDRIDSWGEVTKFPLPEGATPDQMVAGPDGAFWFTEEGGKVGRVTTSGEVSEFDVGSEGGYFPLGGIAVGPDANLWVTAPQSRIVRLTPAGERTDFQLAPGISPYRIAAGPGGLWFTEGSMNHGQNRIGRIALDGTVTQFHVPARFGTGAIAAGPDGRVWFTAGPHQGAIDWIDANGDIGRPRCLERFCRRAATSLALGPEGRLWFGTGASECGYCGGEATILHDQEGGYVGFLRSP